MVGNLPQVSKLQAAIAKDFKGGLNTFDTPLNLSSRFATELVNLYPDTNGRLNLRYGTSLFSDLTSQLSTIVNCFYYSGYIISVGTNGKVTATDAVGTNTIIWSSTVSAALPGAPSAWSTTTFASFTQFSGKLIICNGVDKPIVVTSTLSVYYLQDAGTGSNVNVPRARYCAAHNNYLVLCVTPTDTTTLYIGSKGTTGTFAGDPGADNDGINFNTATYITQGATAITGLTTFRDRLVVTYREVSIAIFLGVYTGTVHTPRMDDVIPSHGAVAHRSLHALGDDVLLLDSTGVSSLNRATITNALTPQRETVLISAEFQKTLSTLTLQQLSDQVFAVHDRLSEHVIFFIPSTGTSTWDDNQPWDDGTTWTNDASAVYVYCYNRAQRFKAWTKFAGMTYKSGCRTEEGRVFLSLDGKLYYYRNQFDRLHMDYATLVSGSYVGTPIAFTYSSPYSDLGDPGGTKYSRYLHLTMEGASVATVNMYIDRQDTTPAVSMVMQQLTTVQASSGEALRPVNNEQLYAWHSKFIRAKFNIIGSASAFTSIVSVGMRYLKGSLRR